MKKYMPLEGLRWSRDSGSALCDTSQNSRSRTGWGGIDNQKVTSRKLLINSDKDGLSRTIRAGYYKAGFANYIHDDGRAANAVLIINRV